MGKNKADLFHDLSQQAANEAASREAVIRQQRADIRKLEKQIGDMQLLASALSDYAPRLGKPKAHSMKPRKTAGPWEMVAVLSDAHATEAWTEAQTDGLSSYDFETFCRNLWFFGEEIVRFAKESRPLYGLDTLHVDMLGDIFHGTLRIEDEVKNDFPTVPGLANTAHVLWQWLVKLAEDFKEIRCTCLAGNHGRLHQKPQAKRYVETNYDTLIYLTLRNNARLLGVEERIRFTIPESRIHTITRCGHRVLMAHGDHISGGNSIANIPIYGLSRDMLGQLKKDIAKIRRQGSGKSVSLIEIGHFHQANFLEDCLLMNGALCPPSPWAVDVRRASGEPKQWIYHASADFAIRAMTHLAMSAAGTSHGFAYDTSILAEDSQ